MATWPLTHNWATTYNQTWSFNTTILTSQSGREQRIAERAEPRRTISTTVLEDHATARTLDRFLWTQQTATFDHVDPVSGYTSTVRFDDQQTISHPGAHVAVSTLALSVEPGSDNAVLSDNRPQAGPYVADGYVNDGYVETGSTLPIAYLLPDGTQTFAGRYVFPFPVNWTAGRTDAFTIPRRVADFGRGVLSVTRPIPFATRAGTSLLLRVGADETDRLTGFFVTMRGRQGEFWAESLLDDMEVVEIVSTTLKVAGADAAAMWNADTVNAGVTLYSHSGGVYRRRVVSASAIGDTTFLQLDNEVPEQPLRWRRCSWMRVSRFASDDLTVQWTTTTVAQSQVQVQTLPYAVAEAPLAVDPLLDYFGPLLFDFDDPLDYIVNVETPLAADWP